MNLLERGVVALAKRLPTTRGETLLLRTFGLAKIPMIWQCRPEVVEFTDSACAILIRLRRQTRNHWGSMYFGALAVGADCAGGYATMWHIRRSGKAVGLIFKDFKADFVQRPMGDVIFRSADNRAMGALVEQAIESQQRANGTVNVVATVSGAEVAHFALTVSLKLAAPTALRATKSFG